MFNDVFPRYLFSLLYFFNTSFNMIMNLIFPLVTFLSSLSSVVSLLLDFLIFSLFFLSFVLLVVLSLTDSLIHIGLESWRVILHLWYQYNTSNSSRRIPPSSLIILSPLSLHKNHITLSHRRGHLQCQASHICSRCHHASCRRQSISSSMRV